MKNWLKIYAGRSRSRRFYNSLFNSMAIEMVFDVGANEGNKSRLFLGSGCKVVAIEPNTDCIAALENIKKKHPQLTVVPKGIMPFKGKAELHLANISEVATFSDRFVKQFTVKDQVFWTEKTTVDVVTIYDLIDEFGVPDFVKLDCEGMDADIIRSFRTPFKLVEFEYTKPFIEDAIASIKHLSSIGTCEFNFSPYEKSRFLFTEWKPVNAFLEDISAPLQNILHGNIFCRFIS